MTKRHSLARQLLASFFAVALVGVAIVTAGSLFGSSKGINEVSTTQRQDVANQIARLAGESYRRASGVWDNATFGEVTATAGANGARFRIADKSGDVVFANGGGFGRGPGVGAGAASQFTQSTSSIVVDGERVGTVYVGFPRSRAASPGRDVAWVWILVAAIGAIVTSGILAWIVTRAIVRPLRQLTETARRFTAGDRHVRSDLEKSGEFGELSQAFDQMLSTIEQTELARRNIAADVSHELRTPLTTLRAGLEELRDGLESPTIERLSALHDQTLRIARVVDDLGALTSAEAATLQLEPTPVVLQQILRRCMEECAAPLRASGIDWEVSLPDGDIVCVIDKQRIVQAVTNIVLNVARHCRQGDEVNVSLALETAAGKGGFGEGVACITIADTGPGIAKEELPRIFDRFFRGRDARDASGSGIGLAVAKQLVEANGGKIDVESEPGVGTRFSLSFPVATPTRL